jgi:hypothetical protein
MWMAGARSLAPFYGIHHRRQDLVRVLDMSEPKWRERGLRVVRVTVSPTESLP